MDDVSVRVATRADVDAVLPMMVDFNRIEGIAWTSDSGRAPLERLVADASLGFVAMIERAGVLVGYAVVTFGYDLEWGGRDAFLTELFLVEDARGKRVGAFALVHVERIARANDVNALHLMVRHENTHARALYTRAGYVVPERVFMTKRFG